MKNAVSFLILIPALALSLPAQVKTIVPDTIVNREQVGNLLAKYLCETIDNSGFSEFLIVSYSPYITTLSWVNPPPDNLSPSYCCWQISIEVERTEYCRDITTGKTVKCSNPFLVSRESLFNGRLPVPGHDCGQVSEKYQRDFELAFKTLIDSIGRVTKDDFEKNYRCEND